MFLETTQECIPGWPPGMRSWKTSRNTLLERLREPILVLSLNVRYLYIEINANVTLLSILWWWFTFSNFFGMGGGVKCLLFHTAPPYNKNIVSKFVSRLFMKLLTVFHISKIVLLETTQECIPGWPPGMRSWETSRNTLLDRLWEPTLALSLNVRYLYIGINANVNLSIILWWTITF